MRYCATRALLPLLALVVALGSTLATTLPAKAATNTTINYQARILQSSGALVADGLYHVEFKIYNDVSAGATGQGACSGNCLWIETRTGVNTIRVVNGYVSVNLGSVAAFPATMPWDQDLFVTMRVGGNGGSPSWDTEMTNAGSRMKISSVPYAFRAAQSFNVFSDATSTASTNTNAIAIQTGNATGATSNSGSVTIDSGTATGTAGSVDIGATNASGVSLGRSGTTTQIVGATLNGTTALLNFAANAPIGTAVATVDARTSFVIPQTTAGIALTLPSPTNTAAGRIVYIANTGSTSFTLNGTTVATGTGIAHIWNGTAWALIGGAGSGSTTIQQAYDNAVGGIITVTATDSTLRVRDATTTFGNTNVFSVQNNGGTIDYFGVQGDGDVSISTRLGIGTITPTASLNVTTAAPVSVATATGTAQIAVAAFTGGVGGSTTIATTGAGGIGGGYTYTGGTGGTAASALTSSTGGAGGSTSLTSGAGGAAAVAGTGNNIGGAGGAFALQSGTGGNATGATTGNNTGGAGGTFTLQAGTGGNATTGTGNLVGGNGGALTLSGGTGGVGTTSGGAGGAVTLQGGTAAAMAGAAGGSASVAGRAGSATGSGGAGGALSLTAGSAGGDNTVSRAGGAVTISAGASRGASAGGAITVTAGSAGSNLTVGASVTGAASGGITFNAGSGGIAPNATATSTGGSAGGFTVNGGVGGAASVAGAVNNIGGSGGTSQFLGGTGGAANGATTGVNTGGTGGAFTFQGGTGGAATTGTGSLIGGTGGALTFSGGTGGLGTTSGGNGGGVTIQGGTAAAMAGAAGGAVTISGRAGSTTGSGGAGGALALTGGAAGGDGTVARAGGAVALTAGASNGGAAGGAVTLTAGAGGNNATAGTATGGNAGGITFNGSNGGVAANATVASTGGSAGGFTVNGGTGGAASVAGTGSNTGGNGGAFVLGAGTGGVANGATSGINTGGLGGTLSLTAGNGGAATTGSGILQGGNGGSLAFSAGRGGAGTATGVGGDITFSTTPNTAAQVERLRVTNSGYVGIGTGTTTSLPNARLTVVAENTTSSQIKLRSSRSAIVANDIVGGIDFDTNDTNLTVPGATSARIQAVATASQGAATYDTALVFSTASGVTLAERWRIGSTGELQGNGASTIRSNAGDLTLSTLTSGNIVINGAGTLEVQDNMNITSSQVTNGASTVNTPQAVANAGSVAIGASAAATVDVDSAFILTQTTVGTTKTLFSPTNTAAGRIVYVTNSPSSTTSFTLYGVTLAVGATQGYVWNGSAWTAFSSGGGSGVTTVGAVDSQPKSANGAVISGTTLYLQTADATNPGLISTGSQTIAGAKTLSAALTITSGGLDLTAGGITNAGAIAGATSVTSSGLIQGTAGLSITGASSLSTGAGDTFTAGNSTGALTLTGSNGSSFIFGGVTVSTAEFNLLDGRDTALVDTTDAVATAITGTGALNAGSITSGFGAIDIGSDTITSGLINGQTISASANFTGTLNVVSDASVGGNLSVTGQTTVSKSIVANNTSAGTTGTTTGTGTATTTLTLTADVFSVNDVVYINNAGQDYYTRVTVDPGTGSYTVSPAVSFDNAVTVEKRTIQNVGATDTDYSSLTNRFFQGYFIGGVTVGTGSTTLSDGLISRTTGDIAINPGSGGIVNVNGTLNATTIIGDGSAITNINSSSITGSTITGLNASNISSGTVADARLSANVALLNSSPTFTGAVTASSFSGVGSGITALDASNISSGTLNDARLSSNISLLNGAQTYSALKTFGAGATISTGQTLTVNGDALTDLTGTGLQITGGSLGVVYGSSAGSAVEGSTTLAVTAGTGLTGGSTITLGAGGSATLNVAYGLTAGTAVEGNTSLTCASGTGNLSGGGNSITLGAGGSCGAITTNSAVSFGTSVSSPLFTGTGSVTVSSGGSSDLTLDSASNVLVVSDAVLRRTAAGTTSVQLNDISNTSFAITNADVTAVANLDVEGAITASSFSGNGASLTALSASNISTGTLADTQLSSNVALLNLAQSFTALKTFGAGASITAGQSLTVNGDAFTDLTGTGLSITSGSLGVVYGSTAGSAVQGNTSVSVAAGTGLTGGSTITLGSGGTATLNVAYGSAASTAVQGNTSLTCASGSGNLTGGGNSITLGAGGSCGAISTNNAVSFSTSVTTPSLTSSAALSIASGGTGAITIDTAGGAGITIGGANSNALTLGNVSAQTTINGTTIVLGASTVRRTAVGTTNYEFNDTANTMLNIRNTDVTAVANLSVEGGITATSLAGSGSGITALSAGNVTSGTLSDSQLTANVVLLTGSQTFTGNKTFSGGIVLSSASCALGSASNNVFCMNGNSTGADVIIGTNDAFRFGIETSGTLRITVDANGLVGIATGLTALTSGFTVNTSFATATATTAISSALTASQQAVFVSGASTTQTLPAASGVTGRIYSIKNTSAGSATTIASAGGTINGATNFILSNANDSVEVQSDGTNWHIVSGNNTYPQVLVEAQRTTAFTLGAVAVLPYNNATTNVGTAYNATTGIFTAPAAGTYEINVSAVVSMAASAGGDFYVEIYNTTGAASIVQAWNGDSNDTGGAAFRTSGVTSRKVTLTAGQQISIRIASNSGGAKTIFTTNPTANALQITRLK